MRLLSSWHGPQTTLKCSFCSDRVARDLTRGVKSARGTDRDAERDLGMGQALADLAREAILHGHRDVVGCKQARSSGAAPEWRSRPARRPRQWHCRGAVAVQGPPWPQPRQRQCRGRAARLRGGMKQIGFLPPPLAYTGQPGRTDEAHLTQELVGRLAERAARPVWQYALAIQKGTRVLISLWDSLMFGQVPGTRPNSSESHSEIRTRVAFCIPAIAPRQATPRISTRILG